MAGTKSSGRPGGNPDIKKYGFPEVTGREPNKAVLAIRLSPSDLESLKKIPGYQELVREKVREIISGNLSES